MDEVEQPDIEEDKESTQQVPKVRFKAAIRKQKVAIIPRKDDGEVLPDGSTILDGQYRLLHVLHQRPRVNLYLGQRIAGTGTKAGTETETKNSEGDGTLVAIRELVLVGLRDEVRSQIKQAAFEEFVSPIVLGSPRLPWAGDRARIEGERHYLIMQLRPSKGKRQPVAVTLSELLLSKQQWPLWLEMETALGWGIQLCRIVARLHRLGVVLGDLDPATVLVDKDGAAEWSPVLLVSWPPAPKFWPSSVRNASKSYRDYFPVAIKDTENAFVAPETLEGRWDERSDVYSLGAILYLLLTRYAPITAMRRIQPIQSIQYPEDGRSSRHKKKKQHGVENTPESIELIPPHLFNARISQKLERVLLYALSMNPAERYPSAFDLVEVLEEIEREHVFEQGVVADTTTRQIERSKKPGQWFKKT